MLAIDPELFADVQGSTDTEVVFHLALTLGLEEDPIGALERTVGLIEAAATRHGVEGAVQGSFGVSDGEHAVGGPLRDRGPARSLFASADVESVRRLYPENPRVARLTHDDRVIVSEPFADLPGAWHEIPQSSAVTVGHGRHARAPALHPAAAGCGHLGPRHRGDRMTVQPRRTT